jgi:hypothetical protein
MAIEDEAEIAASVAAGTDVIAVPGELVDDPPAGGTVERSFLQTVQEMTVAERIKLALRGNRMIRRFVLQNPRVGDEEIIAIAKNRSADDELLRLIAESREWTKNYQVRISLVSNPKTPLTLSMRHIHSLNDRDIRMLAKSKNVSATVANAAKRIVTQKPGG